MKTRDFIWVLILTACTSLFLGAQIGYFLGRSRDYALAEKLASTLNKEAEKTGAWPKGDSPLFQGHERLTDGKGQTVLIINDRYKLRLRNDSTHPQIEPNKFQGK
ncbi:hypothetical protein [Roseimicrobium sp. ORNL1]|uniref:hypothetical protein n=1 Tax=Roseimicrobium sp. ORNL1 TaxID=2711231 RepID=UPI0013E10745|nr:hypothetical protein [Roseimicrobium sp. ORNL1]QIF03183.1 hypothetical protein G5S37_17190 [Roseimicrobium sp. ORNL1]